MVQSSPVQVKFAVQWTGPLNTILQLMTVGLLVPLVFAIGTLNLTVALGRLALLGLGKEGSGFGLQ